jgi:site-specific DNA-methyltransferase (adenine-specific)
MNMEKTNLVQSVMLPLSKIEANRGQIVGLPKNPRVIRDAKFEILKKSIQEDPEMTALREILVIEYGSKYVIIGGNMRFRAMQDLGIKQAPCKIIPAGTDVEKLKAYTIKDNAGFGEWDWDDLANEWADEPLQDWGVDVWETQEEEAQGGETPEVTEDEFDEDTDPVVCRCKRGDIWQLGNHRVMCGDSTSEEDVEKLRGGVLADMVFTDPPYGVSIGDKNAALNNVQPSGRCTTNIENDTLSASELYPILVKAMRNARTSCKTDASYYVTSPQGGELGLMMMMMKDAGLPVRHMLVWEKNCATFSLGRLDYDYQHEPIFYTWTEKHHNYRKGEYRTTIWKYDKPRKCNLHPTMKPVALVVNAIMDGTKEGDVVLDIFGGSGTSVIACEQTGRKCLTMELDPHYCDVIIARWEKLTGLTAVKIE